MPLRPPLVLPALLGGLLFGGCGRRTDSSLSGTASSAAQEPLAPIPASALPPEAEGASDPRAAAGVLSLGDAAARELTEEVADLVTDRFGGQASAVEVQIAPLLGGRKALVLSGHGAQPLLVVLSEDRRVAWVKERPTAGLVPGVGPLTVVGAGDGGVLLVFFEPAHHVIGARLWEAAGGLMADFQVMETEACEALRVIRWPERGFVVAVSQGGRVRGQRLTDRGKLAWGGGGRVLHEGWGAPASLGLALDTDLSFALITQAMVGGERRSPRHVLLRFDEQGDPLLRMPLELGAAPERMGVPPSAPRVAHDGGDRLALSLEGEGGQRYVVHVTPQGAVIVR